MLKDISSIFIWWLFITLIGTMFLPFTLKYFNRFWDKGYIFSKTLGIVFGAYAVWALTSFKLLPFSRMTITIVYLLFMIIFAWRFGIKHAGITRRLILVFVFEEALFLIFLAFWSYIRGLQPDIYGLEKFMDFGFVNTILRSDYMPPVDMWFSGMSINYYYFGHFICAFLTRLSGIDSAVTYNLMIATVFAFAFVLTFSFASNLYYLTNKNKLRQLLLVGILSAVMISFGGNLHSFVYGTAQPLIRTALHLPQPEHKYFYPDSTRYIGYDPDTNDKTIHEFPLYSFVVSDLHGHVSDIPYVITFLALLLAFVFREKYSKKAALIKEAAVMGLFLAVMYMTNAWDYPIYMTVAIILFIYHWLTIDGSRDQWVMLPIIILLSQLFLLPFSLHFKNITGGVNLVHAQTPIYQLLILWGIPFFFSAAFIVYMLITVKNQPWERASKSRLHNLIKKLTACPPSDMICILLTCCALGLILLPEIVYVVDIYGKDYHRANTMFKLTYQAFILFSVLTGYIIVRILSQIKSFKIKCLCSVLFIVVYLLPMTYPFMAIKGYYSSLSPSNYKGLYGLNFLSEAYPGDYAAVQWLQANVQGQSVVLEANGDSYSPNCRISMATGLPTIQGWYVHEWLWRGSMDAPKERAEDVTLVYESADMQKTLQILKKYSVEYIILGDLEREKFKKLDEVKLLSLGSVVFEEDGTRIIHIE